MEFPESFQIPFALPELIRLLEFSPTQSLQYEGDRHRQESSNRRLIHLIVTIIVVGASGVLGSAVHKAFKTSGIDVLGLAYSRTGEGLEQLDLTRKEDVENVFSRFKPDCKLNRLLRLTSQLQRIGICRGNPLCCREET